MIVIGAIVLSVLLVATGWLLRGSIGWRWVINKSPHRFADTKYINVTIDGVEHDFTFEELIRPAKRAAARLKNK